MHWSKKYNGLACQKCRGEDKSTEINIKHKCWLSPALLLAVWIQSSCWSSSHVTLRSLTSRGFSLRDLSRVHPQHHAAMPWQPAPLQRDLPSPHHPKPPRRCLGNSPPGPVLQQLSHNAWGSTIIQCFVINNSKIWQMTTQRSCGSRAPMLADISGWGCERLPHVQIDISSEYLRDNVLYSSVFKLENIKFKHSFELHFIIISSV